MAMSSAASLILKTPQLRVTVLTLMCYAATMASTMPFQSVIGIKELGLSDTAFSGFMFAAAVMNVVASVWLGAMSDSISNRKALILGLTLCGILGYGLIYAYPSKHIFIICMVTLVPLARAAYSILFGGLRRELHDQDTATIASVNSTARAAFILAWIIAPGVIGWWLKDSASLLPAFLIACIASVAILVIYGSFGHPAQTMKQEKTGFLASLALIATPVIMLRVFVIALGSGAHSLHSMLHPLIMTGPAHGTTADVGIYAGLLAGLEIPFMLLWTRVANKKSINFALMLALLVYAIYAVLMSVASQPWHLYAIAILNSCGAAAVLSLPVTAFQDMLKDRPGLATSLVPVMTFTGSLMSSAGFALGTWITDYSGTALVIAAMCAYGAAGLFWTERHERDRTPAP
jgi:predicted MFS family arabinose efflux permease